MSAIVTMGVRCFLLILGYSWIFSCHGDVRLPGDDDSGHSNQGKWYKTFLNGKSSHGNHESVSVDSEEDFSGSGSGSLLRPSTPSNTPTTPRSSWKPTEPVYTTYPPSVTVDGDFSFEDEDKDKDDGSYDEWEGSADGQDDESSGWNGEDDEDGEGSADTVSPCQRLRDELNGKKLIGAYIPRCTTIGEFEAMQCHGSTGECWCVNRVGQQIPGTMRRAPEMPNCNNIDRETEFPQAPIDRNPGYQNPDDRDNTETDRPGPPTDGGDGLVIDPPSPDPPNKVDPDNGVEIIDNNNNNENEVDGQDQVRKTKGPERSTIIEQPGILAGIIGGAVVGLLCAVLLVMFIVYRMRKKDEGSYALDEPKRSPSISYSRARDKEFFA